MKLRALIALSAAFSLGFSGDLRADEQTKLKRKILSNCVAAHAAFDLLGAAEKEELTPYLARVLELHLSSSLGVQPQLPDASRAQAFLSLENKPHDLAIPADPADEIKAKNCALELLAKQGKNAFPALPAMLALIEKPTTPNQLKHQAADLSRDVASIFAHDSNSFTATDRRILSELPAFLDKSSAYVARSVLIELGGYGLPAIIERIPRASEEVVARMVELLQSLQLSGISPAEQLYPLLISGDEAQQIRVIRILVELNPALNEVLPPFIRLLDDLSGAVRLETRRALKKLIKKGESRPIVLNAIEQDLLLKTFRIALPAERREMLQWLPTLINSVEGLEARLIELFASQPPDLKRDIITCISELQSPQAASFSVVQSSLKQKDAALRVEAIQALGRFTQSEAVVLKELTAALQALPPARDSVEREAVQRAVAEAIAALHPHIAPPLILSSLIKMLEMRMPAEEEPLTAEAASRSDASKSRFAEHPAVRALIAIGEPARQGVEKIAKPGNSDQSRRAIAVLGGLPEQATTISILSTLLGSEHPGTRAEAAQALLAQGPKIIPQLRKQIAKASPAAAVAISEIIIRLGEKTLADARKIYQSLKNADCPTRVQGIMLIGDFSESERSEMTPGLISCIGQNHALDHVTIKALARLAPLSPAELDRIVALLRSPDISPQLRLALLDSARELAIPSQTILPLFRELLSSSADTVQVRVIRSLGRYGTIDPELTEMLKGMVNGDKTQRARSEAAVSTLARTSRMSFNFEEWLEDQLDDGDGQTLSRTLKSFPDDFAENLLRSSLEKANDKEKVVALTLLSEIIKPSAVIPLEISNLLTSTDLSTQSAAYRVAAACCPLTPEALSALRELIFSNEVYQMDDTQLNENTRHALEQIATQSHYLSERITARRLLEPFPR